MLFASFLSSQWRWLAYALAIIFAVLVATQGLDYTSTWLARRRAGRVVTRAEQAQAARAAAEAAHRHNFDSAFFSLAGQHREAVRAGRLNQHRYDSLRALFPAIAPVLPANPPRYSASH